ncbi:Golgi complex component 7-domain-containing protein [Suillus bovinus]|uniref:Golgi complex component 7-domain-containing protein n=1 Tax=Suillus bovinus TaxID=48563 RepID=UPI001B867920|nr:Golgi complex component 7-domain-containing protein [Suillus bovinus]KAG2143420.1 Golgi complex component 7-domain-containing protein [Suillus bovinus]
MTSTSASALVQELDDAPDVLTWLNDTLTPQDNHVPLASLESLLADLLTATDLSAVTTSAALERTIDEVSHSAPRLTYDLHFMRDGALSLHSALATVTARIPAETGTSAALDKLQTLDTAKRRMEAVRDVLREAESWSSLEAEVTALLAERAYDKAAERLSEASRSMPVFAGTPEYEPRRALMVSLQNQLEAALSSALVGAINSGDTALCRNFYGIFSNIQRESEFRNYYFGSRRAGLVALWQSEVLEDTEPSVLPGQTFSAFWATFCASFLAVLNAERTSIPAIFPDPQITLSTFITSTLSILQPSCPQRLASLFNTTGSSALKDVIAIYKTTEEFAVSTNKIMEKIQFSVIPADSTLDGPLPPKHIRRRSMRMSMSWRSNSATNFSRAQQSTLNDVLDWDQTLFQAFLDFQVDYGTLERRILSDELSFASTLTPNKNSGTDRARLLRERAVDVFSAAEESLVRCMSFTYGYAAPGLISALDSSLASFVDSWTQSLTENISAPSGVPMESGDDLADLDYSPQDWSNIQLVLHLLASTRAVLDRLRTFESKLRAALVQIATAFRLAQHEGGVYTPGATKGAGSLLAQSSLNSAALHDLLSSTESQPPVPLLITTRTSIASLARALQSSLQHTLLAPLHAHLSSYASLALWAVPGDPKSMRTTGDLHVPVFSLSPSDIVQHVAEGLLNLPRLFEVYADDDALCFSLNTLPNVDEAYLSGLSEHMHAQSSELGHNRRASLVLPPKPVVLSPEAVAAAWLSSLGHSILSHLTSSVLPKIRTLSVAGAAQLSSDLGYLSNIVRALNVEYEELDRWKEYVGMNDEEGSQVVVEKLPGDQVLVLVAKMRGWT